MKFQDNIHLVWKKEKVNIMHTWSWCRTFITIACCRPKLIATILYLSLASKEEIKCLCTQSKPRFDLVTTLNKYELTWLRVVYGRVGGVTSWPVPDLAHKYEILKYWVVHLDWKQKEETMFWYETLLLLLLMMMMMLFNWEGPFTRPR